MPLLIWSGSTSALVVPQKLGPGRLVTTLSTPGFTGLQSFAAGAAFRSRRCAAGRGVLLDAGVCV